MSRVEKVGSLKIENKLINEKFMRELVNIMNNAGYTYEVKRLYRITKINIFTPKIDANDLTNNALGMLDNYLDKKEKEISP